MIIYMPIYKFICDKKEIESFKYINLLTINK